MVIKMEYDANFELNRNTIQFDGDVCKNHLQADLIITTNDKYFTFEQAIASNPWYIVHNLNKFPSVFAVDTAGKVQIPDEITYINKNEIEIKFLAEFAGKAYLN